LKKNSAPIGCEPKNKTSGPSTIRIVSLTRHRPRRYDEAVRRALPVLWEASDRVCSKRLKALLPVLLEALERHQRLRLDPATRLKLTRISAATIDRLLVEARAADLIDRPRRSPTVPRHSSPIQRYSSRIVRPGEVYLRWEASGSGDTMGRRPCTLVLVDVFTGWTDYALLLVPHPSAVIQSLAELCTRLPFRLRGITLGTELEFSATALEHYCDGLGVALTRTRRAVSSPAASHFPAAGSPELAGDAVLEADGATCNALLRLNGATRSFINFFHVSFKLQDDPVDRSTVSRVQSLGTPCTRLLLSTELSPQHISQLGQQAASLDPLQLLEEVRRMRSHLSLLAAGFRLHPPQIGSETCPAVQTLVAPDGRPVGHADTPPPARRWRTHQDAFQTVWPIVQAWLQVNPNQTSNVLFARLQHAFPGVYQEGQLRSLQRRLKDWRSRTGWAAQ
jgi:hypothetical protein